MNPDMPPPLPGARPAPQQDEVLRKIIPYKNPYALTAYYLAVFSLIPVLGIPLGLIALVLGIVGIVYASNHPEAHGRAHACVGIILGGGCATLWTVVAVIFFGSPFSPYAP